MDSQSKDVWHERQECLKISAYLEKVACALLDKRQSSLWLALIKNDHLQQLEHPKKSNI